MNVQNGRIGRAAYLLLCTFKHGDIYNYNDYDSDLLQELKYQGYILVWSDIFGTQFCLKSNKAQIRQQQFKLESHTN